MPFLVVFSLVLFLVLFLMLVLDFDCRCLGFETLTSERRREV
jgi:hypothetical protein